MCTNTLKGSLKLAVIGLTEYGIGKEYTCTCISSTFLDHVCRR